MSSGYSCKEDFTVEKLILFKFSIRATSPKASMFAMNDQLKRFKLKMKEW